MQLTSLSCWKAGLIPQEQLWKYAAETCASVDSSTPYMTLFTAFSLGGSKHLHTFCLAVPYLLQGEGGNTTFSKVKSQVLKSGSTRRARRCPLTLLCYRGSSWAQQLKLSPRIPRLEAELDWKSPAVTQPRGGGATQSTVCALPSSISSSAHGGHMSKRPP